MGFYIFIKNPILFLLNRKPAPHWMHRMPRLEVNNFSRTWKCLLPITEELDNGAVGSKMLTLKNYGCAFGIEQFPYIFCIWSGLCFCAFSTAERMNEITQELEINHASIKESPDHMKRFSNYPTVNKM